MQQRHLTEQAATEGAAWLKTILTLEQHSNEELASSLTDSPLKVGEERSRRAPVSQAAPPPPLPSPVPAPRAIRPPRSHLSACSPSGWPRPRLFCSAASARLRCWRGGPRGTASSSPGAGAASAAAPSFNERPWPPMPFDVAWPAAARACIQGMEADCCGQPDACRRLPTTHATLIRWSAPLFVDIGFTSVGLSVGRTTTCSFVACMGKQVSQGWAAQQVSTHFRAARALS